MRRLLTVLSAFLIVASVSAQEYRHSLGIIAGSFNGVSYKYHPYDNFAIQVDLGASINKTPFGKASYRYAGLKLDFNEGAPVVNISYQINPNFMWQGELTDNLYMFLGGGFSVGVMTLDADVWTHTGYHVKLKNESEAKFGLNGILGLEYCFEETPLTLGLDFRPGYGVEYDHVTPDISYERHFFDWSLSAALRYNF